jgi:hypothetical protein
MSTKDKKLIAIADRENKNIDDSTMCITETPDLSMGKPRKGFVSIIDKETGEYLIKNKKCEFGGTGKENLIVWNGREIIPQVLFHQDRNTGSLQKDLRIWWLSTGIGGADPINVLDPIAPDSPDVALNNEIVIDAANINYADLGKKKPFDSVSFEQDDENDNRFLITRVTTTILYEEANINDLNEAALWLSNSDDPNLATTFELFARVTFSTVRKHENRELIILWYIYF